MTEPYYSCCTNESEQPVSRRRQILTRSKEEDAAFQSVAFRSHWKKGIDSVHTEAEWKQQVPFELSKLFAARYRVLLMWGGTRKDYKYATGDKRETSYS